MLELAWFAAGAAVVGIAAYVHHRRAQRRSVAPAPSPSPSWAQGPSAAPTRTPLPPAPPPAPSAPALSAERIATAVADELANLVSALDVAATDLVACAPEPHLVPRAAERFTTEVRRLVQLHRKLQLLGGGLAAASPVGTCDLGEVLTSLTESLQQCRFGLQVHRELQPSLPQVAIGADSLRELLLFACSTMFHRCGATRLVVAAEPVLEGGDRVRIELMLEWCGDPDRETATEPALASVEFDAARRLAEQHGGMVQLRRCPNGALVTVLELPASATTGVSRATMPAASGARTPEAGPPKPARHQFGGALVIENDPAIRAMLARELRVQGRAVFTCADAGAARAFLQATPERFEVLILDDDRRLDDGDALGDAIRTLSPRLKICLLGQPAAITGRNWPGMLSLRKPFGVDELRRGLAAILDAG